MKNSFLSQSLTALLATALLASHSAGADYIIDRDKIEVSASPAEARFGLRLTDIAEITKSQATVGGKEAPVTIKPATEGKTSIYYLIDVSGPKNGGFATEACTTVKRLTNSLLADGKSQTLFQVGVGTIGSNYKNLDFDLPTQSARDLILDSAGKQNEATSEIYRCALEALEQFKAQPGTGKKVLYILSSGISTDTDKTRNTANALIAAANKEAISIHVISFSKDDKGIAAWQELRNVAKDTAGGFTPVIGPVNAQADSANLDLYGRLKGWVNVTLDLKDAPRGKQPLVVNLDLNNGKKLKIEQNIDVLGKEPPPPAPASLSVTNQPPANVTPTGATLGANVSSSANPVTVTAYYGTVDGGTSSTAWESHVELVAQGGSYTATVSNLQPGKDYFFRTFAQDKSGSAWASSSDSIRPKGEEKKPEEPAWKLPVIIGGGVLLLGLLIFVGYKAVTAGPKQIDINSGFDTLGVNGGPTLGVNVDDFGGPIPPTVPDFPAETRLVIGWLEEYDQSNQMVARHEITHGNFTIGRSSDSSLRFLDDSVSVNHANIHRRSDRSLEITDLRSANQTRVNGKPVEHSVLKDGDKIELGKVRLKLVSKTTED
ncbi:FHA domain-containing protein [Prosthecobacter sp.]|uniref:FHA domain-containing protein n=1 Tax=Prosthecobacter sp. TaxID=1965333 RepID=UPI003783AD67